MQMPTQEGFALEDTASDAGLIDVTRYSTTGMDETSACAGEGPAEASEDRELLADIERLAGTSEWAKTEMESSRALFKGQMWKAGGLPCPSELFRGGLTVVVVGSTVMFVVVMGIMVPLTYRMDSHHG